MSAFDADTAIRPTGASTFEVDLSTDWNIGDSANGGYALSPVLRALCEVSGRPDPLSVTTHFLRPVQGGGTGTIETEIVRAGRAVSVARGTLHHAGRERLVVTAALGTLDDEDDTTGPQFAPPAPQIDPPDACRSRDGELQGVEIPIARRLDVRIPDDRMVPGGSDDAVSEGWIRLRDGSPPTSATLPLFADAFPPSLFARIGRIGWVPTIELTVHVRRRPVPGWIQARLECDDLGGGRMIETGTLWDEAGRAVARSRQLGLLLSA